MIVRYLKNKHIQAGVLPFLVLIFYFYDLATANLRYSVLDEKMLDGHLMIAFMCVVTYLFCLLVIVASKKLGFVPFLVDVFLSLASTFVALYFIVPMSGCGWEGCSGIVFSILILGIIFFFILYYFTIKLIKKRFFRPAGIGR